mgnify:CR=1 FL=1
MNINAQFAFVTCYIKILIRTTRMFTFRVSIEHLFRNDAESAPW